MDFKSQWKSLIINYEYYCHYYHNFNNQPHERAVFWPAGEPQNFLTFIIKRLICKVGTAIN